MLSGLGAGCGAQRGEAEGRRGGDVSIWGACQFGAIHAACWPHSPAGSGLRRGFNKVKKWRGRAEDVGKIALKKVRKREQMQESIHEEEPFCRVDRVQYRLGQSEALVQLQKPTPSSLGPCVLLVAPRG